ncbi:hypothetical protein PHYSODRAFT_248130 [Phytophthora sojae]|uniref:ZNF598/HEL2 PAH domain-containing protein n=1 Tax=Phytophthora sojae (strain P6497) TaxID=1094619 RepID=G4YMI2_PHYSP|nr:hypothetical protein PHYSODRAFT_248130 [Phytophthora sojae]EGZ28608.1 hypothetical protein PHYSODRAFT_248130 [Phytophthora sojae]|eukprot:XP_009515883.1 hypothetical protein PHYSODRAFT_248130 [Phytophthora sojae]
MKQAQPMEADIDPFRLLLPVDTPPTLPDEVPSVYDSAAVEMEKNIKKVVRKLLKKDKARLVEFKMNSRLFGTDFMDSHAYLDTLIKDFGRIRALQLVPCLLSVQPDILKGNALLLTAKNYSLRNEEALRQELRELQVASVMNTQVTTKAPSSRAPTSPSKAKRVASPNSAPARRVCSASEAQPANATVEYISSPIAQSRTSAVPPPSTDISSQKKPTLINSVQCLAATKTTATKPVEPMPEPQEVAPPVINVAVAGPIQQVLAPSLVAMKRAESATSEEEFRVENLFGEIIKTPSPKEQPHKQSGTDALVAPVSPTSSIQSFEEAENLFGERLSSSSPSSVSRRKTVTWGETQTVEVPIQRDAQVKTTKKPLPFLFGPATAAAFDSDSDESDFSD